MMQLNATTAYIVLLLAVGLNSAELSRQGTRLAENLGILLGLPLDVDVPRANASAVPRFLVDVYDCWTGLDANADRSSCLPVSDRTAKNLNDVNVVRGMKGTAVPTTTDGVFSHSPHHALLPASLTYNFNVSLRKTREDIRYAYARIPKLSLEEKELEHVKEQCNGPISLQLLAKTHTNRTDNSNDVFTLLSSARLGQHSVGQSLQVEFTGFTEQFKHWQKEGSRQGDIIEMRLIIGGTDSCYDTLTPQELGFRPNTSGYIVVFSKSDDSEEAIIKAGLAELAAEATASRQRRSVGGDEVVEGGEETPTDATVDHRRPEDAENTTRLSSHDTFNASHYHLHTCRRYSHTISFRELGWENYILQPVEYEANFCAGSCHYPLTGDFNTTKHSYIQSLAAKLHPGLVPPPCCAPHELRPVSVIYEQGNEMFVAQEWHGMRAESCGCK